MRKKINGMYPLKYEGCHIACDMPLGLTKIIIIHVFLSIRELWHVQVVSLKTHQGEIKSHKRKKT